jgi:hypothetical protein
MVFRLWISYILAKGTAVENNLLLIRITWDGRSIDWGKHCCSVSPPSSMLQSTEMGGFIPMVIILRK